MKKILTIDQLVEFCSKNRLYNFSSEESGYRLHVQVPSEYQYFSEKDTETMGYGKVKLLHTNRNRNGSSVTKEAAEKCMSSIKYKPILANFCELENGDMDFTSHDFEINEDGSVNYIERQVGCFTVDEPYLEYDEEKDRYYLYAYAAIPKEYTPAFDIITKKGGTKVSAEIAVSKMSYDAKEKVLILEQISVEGCTLLGTNPDTMEEVQEGMEGARMDIEDFKLKETKFNYDDKLIECIEKLNETISQFNINNAESIEDTARKEDVQMEEIIKDMEVTEEVTESVETTEDEVTEVEENFENTETEVTPDVVEESVEEEKFEETAVETGNAEETVEEVETEFEEAEATETNEEVTEETTDVVMEELTEDAKADAVEDVKETSEDTITYSVTVGDKTFSASMNSKIDALFNLVNDTYADDMTIYSVEVYDEDRQVVMIDCWNGTAYRQNYKLKSDVFTLTGDRVRVYSTWMTQDEQKAFDRMKADFSEIETKFNEANEKLVKYESEPEKMSILESPDYSRVFEATEFVDLRNNHFDLTTEEVRVKADEILLNYAKKESLNFAEEKKAVNKIGLSFDNKEDKESRYGNLFKNKK